jgi:hypothetical protein
MSEPNRPVSTTDMIATDPVLRALVREVESRLDDDAAHDMGHLTRVADWTVIWQAMPSPRLCNAAWRSSTTSSTFRRRIPIVRERAEQSAAVAREILPLFDFTIRRDRPDRRCDSRP